MLQQRYTRIRCRPTRCGGPGGQCNKYFVANLLQNSTVKKFWQSVNICQSYRQKYRGPTVYLQIFTLQNCWNWLRKQLFAVVCDAAEVTGAYNWTEWFSASLLAASKATATKHLMPVSHCPYGFYGQVTVQTVDWPAAWPCWPYWPYWFFALGQKFRTVRPP